MALPRIVVRGKKVILLSGYKRDNDKGTGETRRGVAIDAKDKLLLAAQRNPDAVAFGYVAGHWVASA